MLYWGGGTEGAEFEELHAGAAPAIRANLERMLSTLDGEDLVHLNGDPYVLTHLGGRDVEVRKLLEP